MWTSIITFITGFITKVMPTITKSLPFLAAYKAGQVVLEKKIVDESIEKRKEGDAVAAKVQNDIRDKGVSDTVRSGDF